MSVRLEQRIRLETLALIEPLKGLPERSGISMISILSLSYLQIYHAVLKQLHSLKLKLELVTRMNL